MRKLFLAILLLFSSACSSTLPDVRVPSITNDQYRGVIYEGKTYWPYAVVSKNDLGETLGYIDDNTDERISQYLNYPSGQWLVIWLVQDGGAMLLRAEDYTGSLEGVEQEYF